MGGTGLLCADRIGAPAVQKSPRSPHRRAIRQLHRRLRRPSQLRHRIPFRITNISSSVHLSGVGRLHRLAARAPDPHPPDVREDPRLQFRRTPTRRCRRLCVVRRICPMGPAEALNRRGRIGSVEYGEHVQYAAWTTSVASLTVNSMTCCPTSPPFPWTDPKASGRPRPPAGGPTWCSGWTTAPTTRSSTPT